MRTFSYPYNAAIAMANTPHSANDKYRARIELKNWFDGLEATFVDFRTIFVHPRIKSHYTRNFNLAQRNLLYLDVYARALLESSAMDKVDEHMEAVIKSAEEELDQNLKGALELMKANGIEAEPGSLSEPWEVVMQICTPMGRRYRSLMTKADRLIILIEGLAISGVIKSREKDVIVNRALKICLAIPRAAFQIASRIRKELRNKEARAPQNTEPQAIATKNGEDAACVDIHQEEPGSAQEVPS